MPGHVQEHCSLPSTWFKGTGKVHLCSCGQLWRLGWANAGWGEAVKMWIKISKADIA